jgi:hypothetical protein
MRITTSYEKVAGDPVNVGIWVITQMRDPQRVFMTLGPENKYVKLMLDDPKDINVQDGMVSLGRHPDKPTKIGAKGGELVWMDAKYVLKMESARQRGEHADQGSSVEIYTSPDPLTYIELETLGPLSKMAIGDRIERTDTFSLMRRSKRDPARGPGW